MLSGCLAALCYHNWQLYVNFFFYLFNLCEEHLYLSNRSHCGKLYSKPCCI